MASILASLADGLELKNYSDWLLLVERLGTLTASGRIRRINPLPNRYFAPGGEWYLDPQTGEIYVHGVPNAPVLPSWERFDLLKHMEAPSRNCNKLSTIPTGEMGASETSSLWTVLGLLMAQKRVETIVTGNSFVPGKLTENRFRDVKTNTIYRLIERTDGSSRWERLRQDELEPRTKKLQ